MVQLLDTST